MLLDPTNNRHMETYGNKHVLILKDVKETDFGNYSCMADNSLGRKRGTIEVSGKYKYTLEWLFFQKICSK